MRAVTYPLIRRVLGDAERTSAREAARVHGLHVDTVWRWRRRYSGEARGTVRRRVLAYLEQHGPATSRTIAEGIAHPDLACVRTLLYAYAERGALVRTGAKRRLHYALPGQAT